MRRAIPQLMLALVCLPLLTCAAAGAEPVTLPWIEQMPNLPQPLAIKDWRATAQAYDRLVFDLGATGEYLPLVWLDDSRANFDGPGFGLPSYVGSANRGGSRHEGINCIAAVLGASLAGIDKTQGEHNWVPMCRQYFNRAGGQNIILNNTRAGTGGSFWYELWPAILFFGLADRYPTVEGMDAIVRTAADRWCEAVQKLTGPDGAADFNHTAFDFRKMEPRDNGKWKEPDGAAGAAWLMVAAGSRYKDPKFLKAADACLAFLQQSGRPKDNPSYEILAPWGALAAARANAEQGRRYDVLRFVTWCFDGRATPRGSWGTVAERWGNYDCHGLVGSLTDGGGYAFAMNTFAQPGALVPLVRYDDRFARAIGKYTLNAANAARLFYLDAVPEELQSSAFWKGDPHHVIPYEGLRKNGQGKTPYATGDVIRSRRGPTDLGLYGGSHVGFFGGIIGRTNHEAILRLDCLATDFFRAKAYPTYLYYNPYAEARQVTVNVGLEARDLYDAAGDRFVARNVCGETAILVAADSAVLLVIVPAGGKVTRHGARLLVDGVVADYSARAPAP